ncbi:hypothetical protein ONS95_010049 [Cadophora gregata]|uniref:uncharacterized protein n=1 Tax=Cadophora gregata TaxID=51156 RepID=UPI0026DD59B4|nr:uncharacterized protein ONS95_010049 [Cadophora gregata]KAK0121763.1 hypothetical protein ONS95_010049 [Cadophora gregata]KAK0127240.1 hypothetical protein ONS96_006792 [Cadophora gregata f. sp. sojae]
MPIYSMLASAPNSDTDEIEDEEKLLASFESSQNSISKTCSRNVAMQWILGQFRNEHENDEHSTLYHKFRGYLQSNPVMIHVLLVLAYSVVCFLIIHLSRQSNECLPLIYTPAQDAIVREAKVLSVKINQTSNMFNAEPSPEVDDAWASLFRYANIRITKDEVDRLGRPSLRLIDGTGDYFGTLDVYHQLHCLKYIRQYVHQDYYTVRDTNVPVKDHVNHCIEMLRQVIMCKADTALMTYEWLPDFPGPWPNFGIQHECVNWETIDNWSKQRAIDIFDPKYLQHPKFGFPYPKHE